MRKVDLILMILVITTTVINMFINTGWLIVFSYSLMFVWGVWRYRTERNQAYMWVSILSVITIILSIL